MSETLEELGDKVQRVSDIYARNCDIRRDDDWYVLKLQEELGELVAEFLRLSGRGRMKDMLPADARLALENEAADVLAMLLLFARNENIDLEAVLRRKWFAHLAKEDAEEGGAR